MCGVAAGGVAAGDRDEQPSSAVLGHTGVGGLFSKVRYSVHGRLCPHFALSSLYL